MFDHFEDKEVKNNLTDHFFSKIVRKDVWIISDC
jgi:hypothetical protein